MHRLQVLRITALTMILAGCAASPAAELLGTDEPTPNLPNWGSTPTLDKSLFPDAIDCSLITTVSKGFSWRNLTIGLSKLQDVQSELDQVGVWDIRQGNFLFDNLMNQGGQDWIEIEACFVGTTLSVLNIYGASDLPQDLSSWIQTLNRPDKVNWARDYYMRVLIWSDEGILTQIDILSESSVNVLLFPPIPANQLNNSWIIDALPKEAQLWPEDDIGPLDPAQEVEDPWGIER